LSSRRFRKLELGSGPLDPRDVGLGDADVCRRCGTESRDGSQHCTRCGGVLGGPGQDEFDEAFQARRVAVQSGALQHLEGRPVPASLHVEPAREEAGYGSVLAAAALTACIFALVSIPIRLAFAAAFEDGLPGRAVPELLIVVVVTIAVRRVFAKALQAL
jgi:hypothetical protein